MYCITAHESFSSSAQLKLYELPTAFADTSKFLKIAFDLSV